MEQDKFDSELTTLAREFNVSLRDNARTPPGYARRDLEQHRGVETEDSIYSDSSFDSNQESELSTSSISSLSSLSIEEDADERLSLPISTPRATVESTPTTPRINTPQPLEFTVVVPKYPIYVPTQPQLMPVISKSQHSPITSLDTLVSYIIHVFPENTLLDNILQNNTHSHIPTITDLQSCQSPCISMLGPMHPIVIYISETLVSNLLSSIDVQGTNTQDTAVQIGQYRQALTILQPCITPPCIDGRLCRNKHKDGVLALFHQTRDTLRDNMTQLYTEQVHCISEYNKLQSVQHILSKVEQLIEIELHIARSTEHTAEYQIYPVPPELPSFSDIQGFVCTCGQQVEATWCPVFFDKNVYNVNIYEYITRLQVYHSEQHHYTLHLTNIQQDQYSTLSVIKGASQLRGNIVVLDPSTHLPTTWTSYKRSPIPYPPGYNFGLRQFLPIPYILGRPMFLRFTAMSKLYMDTQKHMITLLHSKTLSNIPEYLKHNMLRLEKHSINQYKPPIRPVLPHYVTKYSENALVSIQTLDQVSTTLATSYNLALQWTRALLDKYGEGENAIVEYARVMYIDSIQVCILTHCLDAYFQSQHNMNTNTSSNMNKNTTTGMLYDILPYSLQYTNTVISNEQIANLLQTQIYSQIHQSTDQYTTQLREQKSNALEEALSMFEIMRTNKEKDTKASATTSTQIPYTNLAPGAIGFIEQLICRINTCAIQGDLRRHKEACSISTIYPSILPTSTICRVYLYTLYASLQCNQATQHEWNGEGDQAILLYKKAKKQLVHSEQDTCTCVTQGVCQEQGLKATIQRTIKEALHSLAEIQIIPPNSRLTRPKSAIATPTNSKTQRANADTIKTTQMITNTSKKRPTTATVRSTPKTPHSQP